MQVAGEASVLGDFGGSAFTHLDVTSRFFTDEVRFLVTTGGPDGVKANIEIAYTFGFEPLQAIPGGVSRRASADPEHSSMADSTTV